MAKSKKISLSSNATAFDKALVNVAESVEHSVENAMAELEHKVEVTNATGDVVGEVTVEDGSQVMLAEEPIIRDDEVEHKAVVRRHMTTGVVKGARQNGIGAPAPNGKCHEAWRMFDRMTFMVEDDVYGPSLEQCVTAAREAGLNVGNVRVEFPRWRKWNGFAAVMRKVTDDMVEAVEAEVSANEVEEEGAE